MVNGKGILTFIYRTDKDLLLDEFINRFEKKITKKDMDFCFYFDRRHPKHRKKRKMFTRICGVDIEDNVIKAVECLKLDGYNSKRFDDLIIYFTTKKKREIGSIMVNSSNNNKKGDYEENTRTEKSIFRSPA
ncbi:hypothetical protein KRN18_00060 (plasmid) [Escherichia coli]